MYYYFYILVGGNIIIIVHLVVSVMEKKKKITVVVVGEIGIFPTISIVSSSIREPIREKNRTRRRPPRGIVGAIGLARNILRVRIRTNCTLHRCIFTEAIKIIVTIIMITITIIVKGMRRRGFDDD